MRRATGLALVSRSEERRLTALLRLKGVSVPMASATLTMLSPTRYGVIDIRVWQLLHAQGVVTRNAFGVGLSAGNWAQFLGVIRHFARKLRVKARDVERALFDAHRARQKGRLYRVKRGKGR